MLTTHYVATVQVLVEAEDEAQACDAISALLERAPVRDWGYLQVGGQHLSPSSTLIEVDTYEEGTFLAGDAFRNSGLVVTGTTTGRLTTSPPVFVDCGSCGHYHRTEYAGDCRDDAERFTADDLDERYGENGWAEGKDCERCGVNDRVAGSSHCRQCIQEVWAETNVKESAP